MQGARHSSASGLLSDFLARISISRLALMFTLTTGLAIAAGCATTESIPPPSPSASTPTSDTGIPTGASGSPIGTAAGTWQGTTTSTSDGGNAVRKITLRMTQDGGNVAGDYACLAGNTACRNLDDSGTIQGKLLGKTFSIAITMSPDNSRCYYTGEFAESLIFGTYQCLAEARIVEIGSFKVKRIG